MACLLARISAAESCGVGLVRTPMGIALRVDALALCCGALAPKKLSVEALADVALVPRMSESQIARNVEASQAHTWVIASGRTISALEVSEASRVCANPGLIAHGQAVRDCGLMARLRRVDKLLRACFRELARGQWDVSTERSFDSILDRALQVKVDGALRRALTATDRRGITLTRADTDVEALASAIAATWIFDYNVTKISLGQEQPVRFFAGEGRHVVILSGVEVLASERPEDLFLFESIVSHCYASRVALIVVEGQTGVDGQTSAEALPKPSPFARAMQKRIARAKSRSFVEVLPQALLHKFKAVCHISTR